MQASKIHSMKKEKIVCNGKEIYVAICPNDQPGKKLKSVVWAETGKWKPQNYVNHTQRHKKVFNHFKLCFYRNLHICVYLSSLLS